MTWDEGVGVDDTIHGMATWAMTCPGDPTPPPLPCGNGVIDDGEDCDDGNGVEDDGCLSTCKIPTSCADFKEADPNLFDGLYTLFYEGDLDQPWEVDCVDMPGVPREYIPLVNTGGDYNFGQYTVSAGQGGDTSVRTNYMGLRVDPETLQVDIDDRTFASSSGMLFHNMIPVSEMFLGIAMGCQQVNLANGVANIDLTGTPFFVDHEFLQCGWMPAGMAEFSNDGQVVEITGGGHCGWSTPAPCGVNLETNTTGIQLQLGYL